MSYRRTVRNDRLVYCGHCPDEGFWAGQWTAGRIENALGRAERGGLGHYERIFPRYLPSQGLVLEAGCGMGQHVVALNARGYECEGVEWSRATVDRVLACRPNTPVRFGDVTDLDVPPEKYAAIISLGVVEHREDGPEPFLREAHRVLEPTGLLLISVPWFNTVRRLRAALGGYRDETSGLPFYQYAFTSKEFQRLVIEEGFEVMEVTGYDPYLGLETEVPGFKSVMAVLKKLRIHTRFKRWLNRSNWFIHLSSHMLMLVCRKKSP